jgi:Zn-dependent hydrolases, including glyoxylases
MKLLILNLLIWMTNTALADVSFKIYRTGEAHTKEAAIVEGGSVTKSMTLVHSALLIKNGERYVLFDTGLGSQIDQQFKDMPLFVRPFFAYQKIKPAAEQIPTEVQSKIEKIYLSHVHWDHASGISDFPKICVAINEAESGLLKNINRLNTFPSQFSYQPTYCNYEWENKSIHGFEKSYDIFQDGSAILVPLPGHTKGSVGLFLKSKGAEYFFVGDLTWNRKALLTGKHKFFLASKIVDQDRKELLKTLNKVKKLAEENKDLIIVPAHDGEAQEGL